MQTRVQAKYKFKVMACRECGVPMDVGSNTSNSPRCVECGIDIMAENLRQIHQGRGPYFDKWLAGCIAHANNGY
jgi:hypothetical protein